MVYSGDTDVANKIGSMSCTIDEATAELEELKKKDESPEPVTD
jgi:hypothetical protein